MYYYRTRNEKFLDKRRRRRIEMTGGLCHHCSGAYYAVDVYLCQPRGQKSGRGKEGGGILDKKSLPEDMGQIVEKNRTACVLLIYILLLCI